MCSRFAQSNKWSKSKSFQFAKELNKARDQYNIVYTESATIILKPGKDYTVEDAIFSLLPSYSTSKSEAIKLVLGNARSETIFEKKSFQGPVINSRCIIPSDAIFESIGPAGNKQPYAIRKYNNEPLAFAGIANRFLDSATKESFLSFSIVTIDANSLVEKYHPKKRMPVILEEGQFEDWLNPSMRSEKDIKEFFAIYPSEKMHAYPVSKKILSPKSDRLLSEECLKEVSGVAEPAPPKIQLDLF